MASQKTNPTVDFLVNELSKNNSIDVVFIDFAKAFYVVSHKSLVKKLAAYGISGSLLKWVQSFLSNRKQRVVPGENLSSWLLVLIGVTQDSVLGPQALKANRSLSTASSHSVTRYRKT